MKGCDILVIEDDPGIRSLIRQTLAELGLQLHEESTGAQGLARSRDYVPKVVLIDLGLPDVPGLEVIRRMRPAFSGGLIVITAWQDDESKFKAFELGADDYLQKPFSPRELLARVRVALRRSGAPPLTDADSHLVAGHLEIDRTEKRTWIILKTAGQPRELFPLTQTEQKFLTLLAQDPGRLISQTALLAEIWGPNHADDSHYLRILVSRLRRKLAAQDTGVQIQTEAGLGYRLLVIGASR